MSRKNRRHEEKEEKSNVGVFTAVLKAKLAETKAELLADIKYTMYEAKLINVQASIDHSERIVPMEIAADSTAA